jgi:hypothetical protein
MEKMLRVSLPPYEGRTLTSESRLSAVFHPTQAHQQYLTVLARERCKPSLARGHAVAEARRLVVVAEFYDAAIAVGLGEGRDGGTLPLPLRQARRLFS